MVYHAKIDIPCKGGGLTGNTLLKTSVTKDHVCVVVKQFKARLVEGGGHMSLTNSEADSVAETLAERSLLCPRRNNGEAG